MPSLTDRQRLELALPASLLFVLTGAPDVFMPADPALAPRAASDIAALRADLRTTFMEPFGDLTPMKQQVLLRRLERLNRVAKAGWHDHTALDLMLMLWCFLKDLIDREVLILWESSTMDRAMRRLMPMCEHGFGDPATRRTRPWLRNGPPRCSAACRPRGCIADRGGGCGVTAPAAP